MQYEKLMEEKEAKCEAFFSEMVEKIRAEHGIDASDNRHTIEAVFWKAQYRELIMNAELEQLRKRC
jgi:hypothetical protein